ncbi:MAG: endoglucanase, partial [Clostridia bacterium]|nr:endoglucanase [Clostridia bacterium]
MMSLTERIIKLNTYIAPSGNEREMLEYVKNEIDKFTDDAYFDPMGNLITVIGKGKGEKVMFSSHSDTIGFIAYYIDDKGFIRVNNLGGLNLKTITGRKVSFVNGVNGLLFYETDSTEQVIKNYFVDIGVSSREEAEKLVPIGTAGSVVSDVYLIGNSQNQKLVSPFLDDRIAVAIQMELIERIYNEKIELKNEFYMVFSVQEEVGIRGAKTAAYS